MADKDPKSLQEFGASFKGFLDPLGVRWAGGSAESVERIAPTSKGEPVEVRKTPIKV